MPKLPQDRAEGAAKQDTSEPELPKPGRYVVMLVEVEEGQTGENSTNPGTDKWVWKVKIDKAYHPELQTGKWKLSMQEHVPLTENMDWKQRQLFEAFGYTVDSETDEIIEDDARAVVYVGHEAMQSDKDLPMKDRRKNLRAKRWVQFDETKWTKTEPADTDDDDNQ